jgi:beta-mannanase
LADLTAGRYDDRFAAWATAAAAQKLPFVLRFAQEMNGDWYSWSDAKLGNRAGDFIGAWRHVHDLFDANGADQVIWNWSVNRVDNLWDKTLARVYPGDDYVDWVGISGYFRTDGPAPTFDTTFARTLAELKRVAPKKLVLLTEVGAGTGEANRVAWINDFFAKLLEHPEILGFTWFNDFKDGGDWRIEYSAATQAAFGAGVADSRYGRLVN